RSSAPAVSVLRARSWATRNGRASGGAKGASVEREAREGGGGDGGSSPGTHACTCGRAPDECFCYEGDSPPTTAGGEQGGVRARPRPMRTASGKLKM
ncbi:unnamed protein product, partial [Scytosiphon promiscuus]